MNSRGDDDRRNSQKEYMKMVEISLEEEKELKEKISRLERGIQIEAQGQHEARHVETAKDIMRLNQHSVNLLRSKYNKIKI